MAKVDSGPKSSPRGPRSQQAQRAKRPSPRIRIGDSRRPPVPHCQAQEAPREARGASCASQ
eukprot:1910961-Alexandrium_andersonii.AAC.1